METDRAPAMRLVPRDTVPSSMLISVDKMTERMPTMRATARGTAPAIKSSATVTAPSTKSEPRDTKQQLNSVRGHGRARHGRAIGVHIRHRRPTLAWSSPAWSCPARRKSPGTSPAWSSPAWSSPAWSSRARCTSPGTSPAWSGPTGCTSLVLMRRLIVALNMSEDRIARLI